MSITKEEMAEKIELKDKLEDLLKDYKKFKNIDNPTDETSLTLKKLQMKIGKVYRRLQYLRSLKNEGE